MAFSARTPNAGFPSLNGYDKIKYAEFETRVQAFDPVYGDATLVYLACPQSALATSTLVTKVATSINNLTTNSAVFQLPDGRQTTFANAPVATVMPTSSGNSGQPVYVTINSFTTTLYSDLATARYFGWFMEMGQFPVLKTSVAVSPASRVWISGTAGRFYQTSSTGKNIVGIRTANTATIVTSTSTVLCNINVPMIQGS